MERKCGIKRLYGGGNKQPEQKGDGGRGAGELRDMWS